MKRASDFLALSFAFLAGSALVGACDLGKITNQATSSAVVVATILSTPPIELRSEAVAGLDAGIALPWFDGGLPFDAGVLFDGGVILPSQNVVALFFGDKGPGLEVSPKGTPGATVTLQEKGGASYTLTEQGGGNYLLSDAFAYRPNATYDFTIVAEGKTYVAEVEKVPDREHVAAFHPAAGFVELSAQQPFTFTRPDPPAGQDRYLGFVNVFPVSASGLKATPTYTNIPSTPLQFLKLIVAPSDWRKQVVEIPGSAFPQADTNYVIVLQSAKTGGPLSDNLFTGSAILAGTSEVAVVKTKP